MTRGHATSRGRSQELLYDPDIPTPTHAECARSLVASAKTATLCTLFEQTGTPYGSFVTFAMHEGSPVFLISELAEHTKNLRFDTKASLLVSELGKSDPLANGRVTLLGSCVPVEPSEKEAVRDSFLKLHSNASFYVDFKDFSFFKLKVDQIRYIGGYGRMSWVEASDWYGAEPDPIAPVAKSILEHMNDDHAAALEAYCQAFSKADAVSEVKMTGIDRYGFEMSATTDKGPRPIRVAFDQPIEDAQEARVQLVALARRARAQLA